MSKIDSEFKQKLVDIAARIPKLQDQQCREMLLRSLPLDLALSVSASEIPLVHIQNTISRVLEWGELSSGESAIEAFVKALLILATGTALEQDVVALLTELEAEAPRGMRLLCVLRGHSDAINAMAWSPDGMLLASCSRDRLVQLWEPSTGTAVLSLQGHAKPVTSVAWAPDGQTLASGSLDQTVRLWDIRTGKPLRVFGDHVDAVNSVAWSPDGHVLASASHDRTVRLWDTRTGQLLRTLEGHTDVIFALAWSPESDILASASWDKTIRLWNPKSGHPGRKFRHKDAVNSLVFSSNGQSIISGSDDGTLRQWDIASRRGKVVGQGDLGRVRGIAFTADGKLLLTKHEKSVRLWRSGSWKAVAVLEEQGDSFNFYPGLAVHPLNYQMATLTERDTGIRIWDLDASVFLKERLDAPSVEWTSAKVVLVGDSGVGKSGLGVRLAEGQFHATDSTHGAQFWQIPLRGLAHPPDHMQAELILWDLGGQPEYRLVHQLFLEDADVAMLLFDCSDPMDPFRGVPYWAKVLKKTLPSHALKLLVSSRVDVSPPTVDEREINDLLAEHQLDVYFRTSAKTGEGVEAVNQWIGENIRWENLPHTSAPRVHALVRELLLQHKSQNDAILSIDQIQEELGESYIEQVPQVEMEMVIKQLQVQGLVYRLERSSGSVLVLLRPELINQYASSIVQAARSHPNGIGAVAETDVLTSNLPLTGFERLEPADEKTVLEAAVELLLKHDLCLREMGLLVFPSQINVTRSDLSSEYPPATATYRFSGSIESIYASLVVRLSYSGYFQLENQWKYLAEFSHDGHRLCLFMHELDEGTGELEIYFCPELGEGDRFALVGFVVRHLETKGFDVQERIRLYCDHCGNEVQNQAAIEARIQAGMVDIACQYCDARIVIPDDMKQRYPSIQYAAQIWQDMLTTAEKRTTEEIQVFKADRSSYTEERDRYIHLLHLSDMRLRTRAEAQEYRDQLEADLAHQLQINHLDYLVISGDVANRSVPEEYEAALKLLNDLIKRFALDASRIVIVPGNHDINWDLSAQAYTYVPRHQLPSALSEEFIPAGDVGALRRDPKAYERRFIHFSDFYKRMSGGKSYPLRNAEQGVLQFYPDDRLLFLALNSCWQIDHYFQSRSGINKEALARALGKLAERRYNGWLKIAVWHHSVTGPDMMDDEFLQLLAVHDFQLFLHGHAHESMGSSCIYDAKRGLYGIGVGDFGVLSRGQQSRGPLQYNLLILDRVTRLLTVETRRKDKSSDRWVANADWNTRSVPDSRYSLNLGRTWESY